MPSQSGRSNKVLWTICLILVVLWALGMLTAFTANGLIHILLIAAVVILLVRLVQGRRIMS
jgi:low affinity Fe/Cu permease